MFSLITWPTELNFRRMIVTIGVQNRSVPDFAISSQGGAVVARLSKSSNSFSSITGPTKLKLCRMILHVGAHSRPASDFAISSRGALRGGAILEIFKSIHSYISCPIELKLGRMILDTSPLNRSVPDFSISSGGRCGDAPLANYKSIYSLQFVSDRFETR